MYFLPKLVISTVLSPCTCTPLEDTCLAESDRGGGTIWNQNMPCLDHWDILLLGETLGQILPPLRPSTLLQPPLLQLMGLGGEDLTASERGKEGLLFIHLFFHLGFHYDSCQDFCFPCNNNSIREVPTDN